MSTDENKAVVQQFGEAMDRKDASFMDTPPGLANSKSFYQQLWAAFPDVQGTPQETISEGPWVAQRVMVSGTMQGAFMGMAPTGKQATWEVIQTFRIADGKIVEGHSQADAMAMMQQLGIGPASGQSPQ